MTPATKTADPTEQEADLFADGEPAEPEDHADVEAEAAKGAPAAEKPKKVPTEYVVLIDDSREDFLTYLPLEVEGEEGVLRRFEGYRREEVLQDLVDEGLVGVEEDGFTPLVAIVPARSFVAMRAKVETRKRVVKAE